MLLLFLLAVSIQFHNDSVQKLKWHISVNTSDPGSGLTGWFNETLRGAVLSYWSVVSPWDYSLIIQHQVAQIEFVSLPSAPFYSMKWARSLTKEAALARVGGARRRSTMLN